MSYRRWMKKWQPVIFWAIAVAFVLGVVWWSVAYYLSRRSTKRELGLDYYARFATAYLVKGATDTTIGSSTVLGGMAGVLVLEDVDYGIGTPEPTRMWIEQDDFSKVYPVIKSYYENFMTRRSADPVFEDYLIRAETIAYMGFMRLLQDYQKVEAVPVSTPSTQEVISYFEENATSVAPRFSQYHLKLVVVPDATKLNAFQKLLFEYGFEEAATKVDLNVMDFGTLKGEEILGYGIAERTLKEMYEIGKGVVGPQPFGSGWVFVEVTDSTLVRNASDLSEQDMEKIRARIVNDKLNAYLNRMRDYYQSRGEAIVINDDNLRMWYRYYRLRNDPEGLVDLAKEIGKYVMKSDGEVNVEALSMTQALYVLVLEREKRLLELMKNQIESGASPTELVKVFGNLRIEDIDEKLSEMDEIRKKVIANLYYEGYRTYGVLKRMVEFFPSEMKYRFEWAKVSAEGKKEVATRLMLYGFTSTQIMNTFMPELQTFFALSHTASTPINLEAMEQAYDLLKFLHLYDAASSTLNDLRKASPTYKGWNFDEMFSELEKLMKPATPATPATE